MILLTKLISGKCIHYNCFVFYYAFSDIKHEEHKLLGVEGNYINITFCHICFILESCG
jgi:hypothetical protein